MVVLGSTGSIGVNTLKVAERFNIRVEALACGHNIQLLKKQIAQFDPCFVCVASKAEAQEIDHPRVFWGEEGIIELIHQSTSMIVVNALVGFLGLRPTIEAIKEGKTVALANKESLVAAGAFVNMEHIRPIDSEHFGLWYLLSGRKPKKMVITASGGAFRDWPIENIDKACLKDALKHPNWSMGHKITIDSATMTNKIFELLEARWLYGCENVDAVIEPMSVIHAMIEFEDGATTAQIANPDMKLPIAYALMQEVHETILEPVDLTKVGTLEFKKITPERYPIWQIKDELLRRPKLGVVINAANEVAIEKFIAKEISFGDISRMSIAAFKAFEDVNPCCVDDVFAIDAEVRRWCEAR